MHRMLFPALIPVLFFAPFTLAQTPQPSSSAPPASTPATSQASQQEVPTVRVRTDEVNVVFTVVDKDGRFVRDLKQDQFRVLDNKLPPRQVMNFAAQTD